MLGVIGVCVVVECVFVSGLWCGDCNCVISFWCGNWWMCCEEGESERVVVEILWVGGVEWGEGVGYLVGYGGDVGGWWLGWGVLLWLFRGEVRVVFWFYVWL